MSGVNTAPLRTSVHVHTTFCDGSDDPAAMAAAAEQQGLGTLGFSVHGYVPQEKFGLPPARTGEGKVMVTVQEQLRELDARTDSPQPIPTGSAVRVTGLAGRDILLVEPAPASSGQQEKQEE